MQSAVQACHELRLTVAMPGRERESGLASAVSAAGPDAAVRRVAGTLRAAAVAVLALGRRDEFSGAA
jgi:hypothetical protein